MVTLVGNVESEPVGMFYPGNKSSWEGGRSYLGADGRKHLPQSFLPPNMKYFTCVL